MANWWDHYPWRNIQTNLRDRDMEDMDAKAYVAQLKELGATTTLLNAAGIVANYDTKLDFQPKNPYLRGSSLDRGGVPPGGHPGFLSDGFFQDSKGGV